MQSGPAAPHRRPDQSPPTGSEEPPDPLQVTARKFCRPPEAGWVLGETSLPAVLPRDLRVVVLSSLGVTDFFYEVQLFPEATQMSSLLLKTQAEQRLFSVGRRSGLWAGDLPSCRGPRVTGFAPHQRPTVGQRPGPAGTRSAAGLATSLGDAGRPEPPFWRLASPGATSGQVRSCRVQMEADRVSAAARGTGPHARSVIGSELAGSEPPDPAPSAPRADARASWGGGLTWRRAAGSRPTLNRKTRLGLRRPKCTPQSADTHRSARCWGGGCQGQGCRG